MLSARSTALRTRVVPAFQGLERLAGTRRGALVLVGAAVVVYAFESAGWALRPGRDLGVYLRYYVQLGQEHPVFPWSMLTRTPVTPLFTGGLLAAGGGLAAEIVMALLFAGSILAWALVALKSGGRRAAILVAAALILLSRLRRALPRALERRGLRGGVRRLGPAPGACVRAAEPSPFRSSRRRRCTARPHPPREPGARSRRSRRLPRVRAVARSRGQSGGLRRRGGSATRRLGRRQRPALRGLHGGARWPGERPVLPGVRDRPDHVPRQRAGLAAARRCGAIRSVAAPALPRLRDRSARVLHARKPAHGRRPDQHVRPCVRLEHRLRRARTCGAGGGAPTLREVRSRRDEIDVGRAEPATVRLTAGACSPFGADRGRRPAQTSAAASGKLPTPTEGEPIPAAHQGAYTSTPDNHIREVWTSATDHQIVFDDPRDQRRYDQLNERLRELGGRFPTRGESSWLGLQTEPCVEGVSPAVVVAPGGSRRVRAAASAQLAGTEPC